MIHVLPHDTALRNTIKNHQHEPFMLTLPCWSKPQLPALLSFCLLLCLVVTAQLLVQLKIIGGLVLCSALLPAEEHTSVCRIRHMCSVHVGAQFERAAQVRHAEQRALLHSHAATAKSCSEAVNEAPHAMQQV